MFEIAFLDEVGPGPVAKARLQVAELDELLDVPMGYWSPQDYRTQWRAAVDAVVKGDDSCLITSLLDPKQSEFLVCYPLYRQDENVVVQHRLLLLTSLRESFTVASIAAHLWK